MPVFPANFNVTNLNGVSGFSITGFPAGSLGGWSVSAAGDVNGDGIADLVIGAYAASSKAGASYVLFGKSGLGGSGSVSISSLTGSNGFAITGFPASSLGGFSVSAAGDVNDDGIDDLVIGAPDASSLAGASYVLFGKSGLGNSGSISVSSLTGSNGFAVMFPASNNGGWSVSGAGDVNGDGIADLVIGAPIAYSGSGGSYVLFGQSGLGSSGIISVSSLTGSNGFAIMGFPVLSDSGASVSRAGDVNDDGIDDLVIGAPNASSYTGASYVLFGRSGLGSSGNVSVASLTGSNGFAITGFPVDSFGGNSVSGAGDVNADGIADLVIGAPAYTSGYNGASYVLFGKSGLGSSGSVSVSSLTGSNGFVITGFPLSGNGGGSVSRAGDVNDDGIDDLVIGAPDSYYGGAGGSYVLFGQSGLGGSGSMSISSLTGSNGFAITGFPAKSEGGYSVSAAGDVNADGIADLVVGAPDASSFAGASYVIFGAPAILRIIKNSLSIQEGQTLILGSQYLNATAGVKTNSKIDLALQFTLRDIQHGRFFASSNPGVSLSSFLQRQVRSGQIHFEHDGSPWAPAYNVSVSYGIAKTPFQAAKIYFQQLPVLLQNSLIIDSLQSVVLTSSNLNATVLDNIKSGNLIFTVSDVTQGYFAYIDFPTVPILSFSQVDVDSGQVEFVSTSSNRAPSYSIAVSDGTATVAPGPATITFGDAPQILVNQITISQGGTQALNLNHLHATAPGATNSTLLFLVNDVHHGQFQNYGQPGKTIGNFTQQQLINGNIQFVHDGSNDAPGYSITAFNTAGFKSSSTKPVFRLSSLSSTPSIGYYSASSPAKIWFQAGGITLPQLKYNRLYIEQGGRTFLGSQDMLAIDTQGLPVFNTTFLINGLTHGQFTSVINPSINYLNFSQLQIADGDIQFVHDGSVNVPSYQVIVNQGPYFSAPYPASIAFRPIYSPPQIIGQLPNQTIIVDEAFSFPLTTSIFSDTTPLHFSASSVGGGQLPSWIHFDNITYYFSGLASTPGITPIQVTVKDAAHLTTSTSFSLKVQPQSQLYPQTQSHTSSSGAIIGGVLGGVIGLILLVMRCYIGRQAQITLQKAADDEATQKTIRVLAKEIFEKVKLTGCCGYLSESNAKAYIKAIENIVLKLDLVNKTQQFLWIDEIATQIKKQANKSYCYSFFKPEISPQELSDKAEIIVRAVQHVLSAGVGGSNPRSDDVEMSDVRVLSA